MRHYEFYFYTHYRFAVSYVVMLHFAITLTAIISLVASANLSAEEAGRLHHRVVLSPIRWLSSSRGTRIGKLTLDQYGDAGE